MTLSAKTTFHILSSQMWFNDTRRNLFIIYLFLIIMVYCHITLAILCCLIC